MRPVRPNGNLPRRSVLGAMLGVGLAPPMLSLSGCSGSDPSYYTLTPWPGVAKAGGPLTVELRTPSVASFLSRDYIVRTDKNYRLKLADNAAWASDLADMIGRNLALDLGQRLPGSNIYTQTGAISTEPLAMVELDVSRFLEDASGRAEIEATLAVSRPGSGPVGSRPLHFARKPTDDSIGALVAALSELLGQVADAAADALRALPPMPSSALSG
jgi:uncharacterized protein